MKVLALSVMLSVFALLTTPTQAADVAAGKARAEASCVDCHGDDGKGDDESPEIAGLSVEKFTKAIHEYQDGTRTKNAKMTKEAKKLSAAEVANLAAYYASLK